MFSMSVMSLKFHKSANLLKCPEYILSSNITFCKSVPVTNYHAGTAKWFLFNWLIINLSRPIFTFLDLKYV